MKILFGMQLNSLLKLKLKVKEIIKKKTSNWKLTNKTITIIKYEDTGNVVKKFIGL